MLNSFIKWWSTRDVRRIESYLASSTDLVELERRQQMLARKGIY
jgi:hypothetical protein